MQRAQTSLLIHIKQRPQIGTLDSHNQLSITCLFYIVPCSTPPVALFVVTFALCLVLLAVRSKHAAHDDHHTGNAVPVISVAPVVIIDQASIHKGLVALADGMTFIDMFNLTHTDERGVVVDPVSPLHLGMC
jgi:hypothetical protein